MYPESPLIVTFAAGTSGAWFIDSVETVAGAGLPWAPRLAVIEGGAPTPPSLWRLAGTTSNLRYTMAAERAAMGAVTEGLGRAAATRAALIPITKSPAWWAMAQDERRAVFEEQSRHIRIGMEAMPAVARRLHHCRDLGGEFDFLTWFEFAPEHEPAFDRMLASLRATPEWRYVLRETDIRLTRADA